MFISKEAEESQTSPPILNSFYRGLIESVLTSCLTVWYGNCTASNRKTLQRIVRTADKIIGVYLPTIDTSFNNCCIRKAIRIEGDTSDPFHGLFTAPSCHLEEGTGASVPPLADSTTVSSLRQSDYSIPSFLPAVTWVSRTPNPYPFSTKAV